MAGVTTRAQMRDRVLWNAGSAPARASDEASSG